jgi:hypothetical protein
MQNYKILIQFFTKCYSAKIAITSTVLIQSRLDHASGFWKHPESTDFINLFAACMILGCGIA